MRTLSSKQYALLAGFIPFVLAPLDIFLKERLLCLPRDFCEERLSFFSPYRKSFVDFFYEGHQCLQHFMSESHIGGWFFLDYCALDFVNGLWFFLPTFVSILYVLLSTKWEKLALRVVQWACVLVGVWALCTGVIFLLLSVVASPHHKAGELTVLFLRIVTAIYPLMGAMLLRGIVKHKNWIYVFASIMVFYAYQMPAVIGRVFPII